MDVVLASTLVTDQHPERTLATLLASGVIALEPAATRRLDHLRARMHPFLQLGQRGDRGEVALRQLEAGRERIGIGTLPAGRFEVRGRDRSEVHAPRREHADVPPRDRVCADVAALEHVHVEATVECGERGLESDRAGADHGQRVAIGEGHAILRVLPLPHGARRAGECRRSCTVPVPTRREARP